MSTMMDCFDYKNRILKEEPWKSEEAYENTLKLHAEMLHKVYFYSRNGFSAEKRKELLSLYLKYPNVPKFGANKDEWNSYLKVWEDSHNNWLNLYARIKLVPNNKILDEDIDEIKYERILRPALSDYFKSLPTIMCSSLILAILTASSIFVLLIYLSICR